LAETKMSELIKTSIEGIKNFTDLETAIGKPIHTPSGVTVIPVSKVSLGFATGGLDFTNRKFASNQNFGGGGGTGVSITPLAFLTIGKNAEIDLIPINSTGDRGLEHTLSVIEHSPEIIKKIKDALS
jgi:sporulation protein YtfJ